MSVGLPAPAPLKADMYFRPIFILYHANCADGFGAAYAAWCAYGNTPRVQYIAVSHGDLPPEMPRASNVYILDFSYPREVLLALKERVHAVRVIDHHKTAAADLAGLDFATFDQEHSGAVLAWQHFQGAGLCLGEPPALLRYIEDRDLWRWELPASRAFSAGLALHSQTFTDWQALDNPAGTAALMSEGEIALRYQQQLVARIANEARQAVILNHVVWTTNTPVLISESCDELLRRNPQEEFSANYFDTVNNATGRPERVWSLRARPGFDVSAIAKQFHGGGGHAAAAGFRRRAPSPL